MANTAMVVSSQQPTVLFQSTKTGELPGFGNFENEELAYFRR